MRILKTSIVAAVLVGLSGGAWASEYEPDDGTEGHVPVVAYEMLLLPRDRTLDPAIVRADLDYTAGMKRHHEGAVTMSTDYLADPAGINPVLRKMAHAIIANQRFEIAVLDDIRRRVEKDPQTVADLGFARLVRREIRQQRRRLLMGDSPFGQSFHEFGRIDARAVLQNGVLGGVFARACQLRMAKLLRGIENLAPFNLRCIEERKPGAHHVLGNILRWQTIFDDGVESSEQGPV